MNRAFLVIFSLLLFGDELPACSLNFDVARVDVGTGAGIYPVVGNSGAEACGRVVFDLALPVGTSLALAPPALGLVGPQLGPATPSIVCGDYVNGGPVISCVIPSIPAGRAVQLPARLLTFENPAVAAQCFYGSAVGDVGMGGKILAKAGHAVCSK